MFELCSSELVDSLAQVHYFSAELFTAEESKLIEESAKNWTKNVIDIIFGKDETEAYEQ